MTASVPSCSSVIAEHRRLFSFGKSLRQQNPVSNKSKTKKKGRQPMCTLKFFCLSSTNAVSPPSNVKEKTELYNAGLGDCSISLEINDDETYCNEKLIDRYSKLPDAGGYELLLFQRGGGDSAGFHLIRHPYTSSRLKEMCGQSKIYIRPLQKHIQLNKENHNELEQGMKVSLSGVYSHYLLLHSYWLK